MSLFKIPRTSQPQGPCGIDWSNPITRGLVFVWTPTDLLTNSINQEKATKVGTLNNTATLYGQSPRFGSGNLSFTTGLSDRLVGDLTVLSTFVNLGGGYPSIFADTYTNGATASPFSLGMHTGQCLASRASANGWRSYRSGDLPIAAGLPYTVVSAFSGNIENPPAIHQNGIKCLSLSNSAGSGTGPATHNSRPIIIGNNDSGNVPFTGNTYLNVLWERKLSDAEAKSLSANPWQIFQPITVNPQFDLIAPKVYVPRNYWRARKSMMLGSSVPAVSQTAIATIRKTIRTTQPQGAVEIDWNNPITEGLWTTFIPTAKNQDFVLETGTISYRSSSIGTLGVCNAARLRTPKYIDLNQDFTLFFFGTQRIVGAQGWTMCLSTGDAIYLGQQSGWVFQCGSAISLGLGSSANAPMAIAGTKAGTTTTGYANGKKGATGSVGALTEQRVTVLADGGATYRYDGGAALAIVFSRALSDTEIKSLSSNPWQIFKPDKRIIGVSA